jgi:hypothetical protein
MAGFINSASGETPGGRAATADNSGETPGDSAEQPAGGAASATGIFWDPNATRVE